MVSYAKDTGPKTTIWKTTPGGEKLVKTFDGLPYGTEETAFIEGLGEARLSGIRKSGSGRGLGSIIEVRYTLK